MKNTLVIIGAGGQGKVVADCAEATQKFERIIFADSNFPERKSVAHWPIVCLPEDVSQFKSDRTLFFVAIGNNSSREHTFRQLLREELPLATLIHPSAILSPYSSVGVGTIVCANACINPFSQIGRNCIVNTSSSIDHDCTVQDHVHIAPGAKLAGSIQIGERSFIGIGAVIIPEVTIGIDVIIGAGSTVLNNLGSDITVVGSPARIIRKRC